MCVVSFPVLVLPRACDTDTHSILAWLSVCVSGRQNGSAFVTLVSLCLSLRLFVVGFIISAVAARDYYLSPNNRDTQIVIRTDRIYEFHTRIRNQTTDGQAASMPFIYAHVIGEIGIRTIHISNGCQSCHLHF